MSMFQFPIYHIPVVWATMPSLCPVTPMFKETNEPLRTLADKIKDNAPLCILEELCKYPVLYLNTHFRQENENESRIFVVTLSNAEPIVDEERKATWQKKDIAVDLFYDPSLTLDSINTDAVSIAMHWVNLFCSTLTFRGHEVFLENKLFHPFE